jgi:hypothetical protein
MLRTATAVLCLGALVSAAPWALSLNANLNANQNAYSSNWTGTETGLLSWAAGVDFGAESQLSSITNNKNTLKLALGYTTAQDTAGTWGKPGKSTDLIDFESVLRFTLGAFVDPFASARLESQFIDASDTGLTRYVNPMKLTEALGVARVIFKRPKSELVSKFGGAFKQNIDRQRLDTQGARSTVLDNYGGLLFTTDYNTPLFNEAVTYTSKLSVFQALFFSGASKLTGPDKDYWKMPDVNWENTFTANITKLLVVNLYAQLQYDREVHSGARLKEALSVGLSYRLI